MNRVTLFLITTLLLAGTLTAMGADELDPSRTDYGSFESLTIAVAADTEVLRGPVCSVEADIPRSLRGQIIIDNTGGRLTVERKRGSLFNFGSDSIRLTVTMPELDSLQLSASGRLDSRDTWRADRIEISSSGSADLRMASLEASRVSLTTTGSGDLRVENLLADESTLRSTGSGNIEVDRVESGSADFSTTGSGDITAGLNAQRLKSNQTGSGDIRLSGSVSSADLRTTGSGNFEGSDLATENVDLTITGSGDIRLKQGSRIGRVTMTGSGNLSLE